MRKIIVSAFLVAIGFAPCVHAHTVLGDASALIRGTLPNARLDPSSVTLQGNNFNFTSIVTTIANVNAATTTLRLDVDALRVSDSTGGVLVSLLFQSASSGGVLMTKALTTASTTSVRIDQHQLAIASATAYLSGGALAVYDEGSSVGNATTINCSGAGIACSQSGTTTTVTVSGASASVSTSSLSYGLVVSTNGGTNYNLVAVTADGIDIGGCYYTNISTQVDLSTPSGRIGGSAIGKKAATWHTIFLVSDNACTTYGIFADSGNVVLSTSLPLSGSTQFTKQRPVMTVYVDASGNIVPMHKRGRRVSWWQPTRILSAVDPGSSNSFLDLVNVVSPRAVNLIFGAKQTSGSASFGWIEIGPANTYGVTSSGLGQNDANTWGLDLGLKNWYMNLERPLLGVRSLRYLDPNGACNSLSIDAFGYDEEL